MSSIFGNTLLTKESTYSNIRHIIVTELPSSVHEKILSSNGAFHRSLHPVIVSPLWGVVYILYRNKLPIFVVSVYLLS